MRRCWLTPLVLLLLGCGSDLTRSTPPLDCSVNDAYEFTTIFNFNDASGWFGSGDCTGGRWDPHPMVDAGIEGTTGICIYDPAIANQLPNPPVAEPIPEPGGCDPDPAGLVNGVGRAAPFLSYGHNDWGAIFGTWGLLAAGAKGPGTEGIAIWARAPSHTTDGGRVTTNTVWFYVGDWRQVVAENTTAAATTPERRGCVPPPKTDVWVSIAENGQTSSSSYVPAPNECGNLFRTRFTPTSDQWQLYLLPWDVFQQEPYPNRNPDGIDPRDIRELRFMIPRGATIELWVDNISFYRTRTAGAGGSD
jgi:hypothetical protein